MKKGNFEIYDPDREHDACGIGAIVNIDGSQDHSVVEQALDIVEKLELHIQNGILPGKNLIVTADSLDDTVDMVSIGRILDSFCISS